MPPSNDKERLSLMTRTELIREVERLQAACDAVLDANFDNDGEMDPRAWKKFASAAELRSPHA